ncbi:MAG: cytochrome c [Marinosulfonomonas sp.]|nr:cytochrome c [Marinosulfonomonas sp.]
MIKKITFAAVGLALATTAVFAESPHDGAIAARKAHMQLYGHNLGILGGMAKGAIEYDADAASAAATNLATLTKMSQGSYWPQGSEAGAVEGSRALGALWQNFPDVGAKSGEMAAAAAAMETAAGGGLDALRGAIGGVGGACGACHKAYRQPK